MVWAFFAFPNWSWKTTPSVKKSLQKGQCKGQLLGHKIVEFAASNKILYFQLMDRQNLSLPISLQILSYHSSHFGTRLCGFTHSWEMDRQNVCCSAHSVYPYLKNVCGHSILNQKWLEFEGFRPFFGFTAFMSGLSLHLDIQFGWKCIKVYN